MSRINVPRFDLGYRPDPPAAGSAEASAKSRPSRQKPALLRRWQAELKRLRRRVSPPRAFGLDVSDASLKALELKRNKGVDNKLRLAGIVHSLLPTGVIENGVVKDAAGFVKHLQQLPALARPRPFSTRNVIVNVPETQVYSFVITLKTKKEGLALEEAVREEAKRKIPLKAEQVTDDFIVLTRHPEDEDEGQAVVYAAADKHYLAGYQAVFQQAGLKVTAFDIESASMARALIGNDEQDVPVLLVDIGARTTIVTIFDRHGIRFSSNVRTAGAIFTGRIAEKMNISRDEAEKLKTRYGLIAESEQGREVMRSLLGEVEVIVDEIRKAMQFYNQTTGRAVTSVRLCGGSAQMPGLPRYLSQALSMTVELGDINALHNLETKDELARVFVQTSLRYVTVFGLAMRGLAGEAAAAGINLLPAFERYSK